MAKKSILDLYEMKRSSEQIAWLTAYDYPTATFEEAAGVDMILVGDSLGMCVYGYPGTVPVTMDQCLVHCEAVRRGAPGTFVVGDMPFGSYQVSDEEAVRNGVRFLKEGGVDAVHVSASLSASPWLTWNVTGVSSGVVWSAAPMTGLLFGASVIVMVTTAVSHARSGSQTW